MADPKDLLAEFATALEAGSDPDPREFLARAPEDRRQELAELIDRHLMTAPRRAWDPVAYEASMAKAAVDQVFESIEGFSGTWPELLPRLRNRARIRRAELVERLAEALGVGTGRPQVEKVGGYYNRMEHGLLPADGVSARVIAALASILGASAESIRAAGAAAGSAAEPTAEAYARLASPDAAYDFDAAAAPGAEAGAPARDEIDELFTGG